MSTSMPAQPCERSASTTRHRYEELLAAVDGMNDARPAVNSYITPGRPPVGHTIGTIVSRLHVINARVWDSEDEARTAGEDLEVAAAKRMIDRLNLARHDHTEAVDDWVLKVFPMNDAAELHTETIGMVIDRLSVLSLRESHYRRRLTYTVDAACEATLAAVETQKADLRASLELLLTNCLNGHRRFRQYRAFKAYGDTEQSTSATSEVATF